MKVFLNLNTAELWLQINEVCFIVDEYIKNNRQWTHAIHKTDMTDLLFLGYL